MVFTVQIFALKFENICQYGCGGICKSRWALSECGSSSAPRGFTTYMHTHIHTFTHSYVCMYSWYVCIYKHTCEKNEKIFYKKFPVKRWKKIIRSLQGGTHDAITSSAIFIINSIINSISEDPNAVKIHNTVVNAVSVLLMSLNNSIKAGDLRIYLDISIRMHLYTYVGSVLPQAAVLFTCVCVSVFVCVRITRTAKASRSLIPNH